MISTILAVVIVITLLFAVGIAAYNLEYHDDREKGFEDTMDIMDIMEGEENV